MRWMPLTGQRGTEFDLSGAVARAQWRLAVQKLDECWAWARSLLVRAGALEGAPRLAQLCVRRFRASTGSWAVVPGDGVRLRQGPPCGWLCSRRAPA